MIFNGDINGLDIVTLTNDLASTNNTVYPLTEKARSATRLSRKIWSMIFEAYGGWQYDDVNNTTSFPRARANMVAGQKDYTLPEEAMTIRGIEVERETGTFENLIPMTEEEIREISNEVEFMKNAGEPQYYQPIGNSFKLYPTPDTSRTNGIRISFDSDIVSFLPTDTTKTPGWATQFHEMLAVGMALDFIQKNPNSRYQTMKIEFDENARDLKRYYQARYKEKYPPRLKVKDATQNYI